MKFSRHPKTILAISGVFAVPVAIIIVAALVPNSPPVRMVFLRTTSTSQGLVCVFRVENPLTEQLTTRGGFYQRAEHQGLAAQPDDLGAGIASNPFEIHAQSTNFVEVMMPTNRGAYRLVLPWRRASTTIPTYGIPRMVERAKFWLARVISVSPEARWRWLGWIYVTSDTFQIVPTVPLQ